MQITIDILGDISLTYTSFDENQSERIAEKINQALGKVDYRIADLEAPVVLNKIAMPIEKCGPNLRMPERSRTFLKRLQVDGFALANNHIGDYGEEGIIDTIEVLEGLNKDYVGSAREYEKIYQPLRKVIKGIKVSFFSICENEFGISHDGKIGAAGYNKEKVKKILYEENQWCDFSIIIFHGGTELYPYPTLDQKTRYHDLIDIGASAVIGMHSHCPQGYEIYHNMPIIYSVGNFFFPKDCETPFEMWKIGYSTKLKLKKGHFPQVHIVPFMFDIYGRDFFLIDKSKFLVYLDGISDVIQDTKRLKDLYSGWAVINGKSYYNRLCDKIITQGKESYCLAKNLFSCETHNELLRTYLNILYENNEQKYLVYVNEIKKYMKMIPEKDNGTCNEFENLAVDTVIWGIGKKAETLFYELIVQGKRIIFVDRDILKQGFKYLNREIISPKEAIDKFKEATFYICTSRKAQKEIVPALRENGILDNHIVCK